ncbi:hypothetical protein HAX54_044919, partial [Datura stramonium]|nr:hypothetical protein [Datura stramonium]
GMASHAKKGKEVCVASKGFKRIRKGVASSSSAKKDPLQEVWSQGRGRAWLKWFNTQKEA